MRKNTSVYDHFNAAVLNLYQIGRVETEEEKLVKSYLSLLFEAWSFYYLRTLHQLGYVAEAQIIDIDDVTQLVVFVEGYRWSVNHIDRMVEKLFTFIENKIRLKPKTIVLPEFLVQESSDSHEGWSAQQFGSLADEVMSDFGDIISMRYFNQ